jgi:hypothetical protein
LSTQANRQVEVAGLVKSVENFCQLVQASLEQATFAQKRQLVELLIDRVIVHDGDVEIRYVIPTTPESEHIRFCHLRSDYFYNPTPREDLKASQIIGSFNNFKDPASQSQHPIHHGLPLIAAIGPNQVQSFKPFLLGALQ